MFSATGYVNKMFQFFIYLFFLQCRAFFSGTAGSILKIFGIMIVSGKWIQMTLRLLAYVRYWGSCLKKYVEHRSQM
jgi:hypothetical protein